MFTREQFLLELKTRQIDIENLSIGSGKLATDIGYDSMMVSDEERDDGLRHLNFEAVKLFERLLSWLDQVQQIEFLQAIVSNLQFAVPPK